MKKPIVSESMEQRGRLVCEVDSSGTSLSESSKQTEPQEESRVALIGILVENRDCSDRLNAILHQFSRYIVGRMGVPYYAKGIGIICVIVDAPAPIISEISGKLGMLSGLQVKTMFAKSYPRTP